MKKIVHSSRGNLKSAGLSSMTINAANWSLYTRQGHRKYLNGDERRRFMAAAMAAAPLVRTFCLTLAHIGCRISEALTLTAYDIDVSSGSIAVCSLKKRGQLVIRQIPTPPALLNELSAVHGLAASWSDAQQRVLWPWGRTRGWQHVKAVMAAADIHHQAATPKGLRHTFGVHAVLSGVPLTLVQKWLGHADIATTAIYTNLLGPEEREMARRMWHS